MSHINEESWLNELRKHPEQVAKMDLSKMGNRYLREFADYVDWSELSRTKNFGIDFLREMADRLDPIQLWKNKHIKSKAREEILIHIMRNKQPEIRKIQITI